MSAAASEFRGTSRFEVLGHTGQGGAGVVYEVFDHDRNARLALKTLRSVGPQSILLLKNEFRAIQGLSHPNLVTPKELFEEGGRWFFTMDFVDGTDFLAYVRPSARAASPSSESAPTIGAVHGAPEADQQARETAPLDEERLRSALGQLAVGLSALHADHKVHRDVKPSNVLVGPGGHVHILDFGIVTDLAGVRANEEWELVGTVVYMAPEQAMGEAPTPAADWYAVGSMLYQALTGRAPFSGTTHEILARKALAEPPAPEVVAPGVPPDLNQLAVDLLRVDPSKRPEGFEILARLGVSSGASSTRILRAASFVGRSAELRAIDAAFERTAAGEPVTVLVEGDSGVGKSWLVREFTRRAAARHDALVFRGRCYERESLPYKAVDSLVDDLARYLSSLREDEAAALLPEGAGALRTAFPVLETIPALRESRLSQVEVRNPHEARARMFDAFRTLLVNIALYRRLVLVIDDLQWADEDSLALLTEVLRPPSAPPLLLLASIRSATDAAARGLHERLAQLPGDARKVHVAPLPPDDARELISNLLSADPNGDTARDVEAIFAEAKGHPLFIEEIVRYRASHAGDAPTRLDAALWERAQGLSPEARRLLELVVVAGVPLPQDVAARAGGLDFGQTFDAVGVLRAAHFVRTSGVYRHDTVEAYHDRVRESVLHNIDLPARRRLHASLARALEETGNADAERLIPHWVGAGEAARAADCAIRAGEAAAATLAFDHAASLYRLALAIELGKPEGDAALSLQVKLAEALTNAGRGADAAAAYLAAAGDGTSNRAIDLRRRAGEQLVCSGRVDEGRRTFESVLQAVGVRSPRSTGAIILSILASSAWLSLRGLGFVPRAEATLDPRDVLRIDCLGSAGPGLGMSDHVRGKDFQIRTVIEALKLGEPSRVGRALAYYALAIASEGTPVYAKTMEVQRLIASMARELKQPYLEGMASGVTAFACYLNGRPRDAREPFEQAEAIFRDQCIGAVHELASARMLQYRTLFALGELNTLVRRATACLNDAEQRGDIYTVVNLRTSSMSLLALARDDVAAAERELSLAGEHLSPHGFHVQHGYQLLAQIHVLLYRGDAVGAEAALLARMPALKRSLLLRIQNLRISVNDVHARTCLAIVASGGAPAARARKEAERLARAVEAEGWALAIASAEVIRAGLRAITGEREQAAVHLAAAERGFESVGMALHAAVVRHRRGELIAGEEGRALVAASEAWMAREGIRNPGRMCALFAPGFPDRR
jgi:hypothetical protein